jgi:GNAT superfamily N-acetyltransferase
MFLTEGLSHLCAIGRERGVQVSWNADLHAFAEAKQTLGLGEVTTIFEANRRLGPGFWLPLHEIATGELVGVQAIRMTGAVQRDLGEHIAEEAYLYPPVDKPVDPERTDLRSNVAWTLTGNFAYHGEFCLHPKMRGRGLGPLFFRFAQALAWRVYHPDVVFGFTGAKNTNASFAHSMGYAGYEPEAVVWSDAEGEAVETEGLVWTGQARLAELADDPLGDLEIGRAVPLARAG